MTIEPYGRGEVQRFVMMALLLVLAFGRWGACSSTDQECVDHDECEDGNECTNSYCKEFLPFCEKESETGFCRHDLVPDGTPCEAPGKDDGWCEQGECRPSAYRPPVVDDAGSP